MSDRVSIEISDGVADVRMDRADKMNAMDSAMSEALIEASDSLALDPSVRAVVLSGNGRSFCAGLDFGNFQAMAGDGERSGGDRGGRRIGEIPEGRITHRGQQAAWGWRELPVPVIAAVHGVAFGAGIQIALGCDLRIVHPDVRMSVLEIRWGLVPDMTGTWVLPELVGPDVAKELIWTGREVNGEEAVRIGLATRLSETPLDDALELARTIAGKSPQAIRGGKRLVDSRAANDVAAHFAQERAEIGAVVGTPNQVESVKAFFEKRPPVYEDVDPS